MSEIDNSRELTPDPVSDVTATSEQAATETGKMPLLKVDGLKKYFPIQTNFFGKPTRYLRAVDDISFDVDTGKTIGVVGESGCGKTTLGRTVLKLYDINGGKIYFDGNDITDLKKSAMQKYRTDIQLIFQDPYSSLPPRMTIGSIIAEPVKVHKIVPKDQVHTYVLDIMKKCGLKPQHYDRYPHEFSGGQRQRICIARALAVKPKLVICDEPVSALDVSIQAQIINLLKELQDTMGLAYVFISHDLSVVKYITDKILVMYLGNAMELSETEELFDNPLHPYTKALFSAVPAPNPNVKMNRIVLEGDIPSPANPPSGCKFHTRCSQCMKVCKFKQPEYIEVGKDHFVACHLYNKEIMSHLSEYDDEYDRLEEQKRIEAEQAEAKKKNTPFVKFFGKLFKRNKDKKPSDEAAPQSATEETTAIETPIAEQTETITKTDEAVKNESSTQEVTSTETPTEQPVEEKAEAEKSEPIESVPPTEPTEEKPAEEESPATEKPTAARKTTTAKKPTTAKKTTTASKSTAAKKTTTAKTTAVKKTTTAAKSTTASKATAAKKTTNAAKSTSASKTTAVKKTTTAAKSTTASKTTTAAKSTTAKKTTTAKKSAGKTADKAAEQKVEEPIAVSDNMSVDNK